MANDASPKVGRKQLTGHKGQRPKDRIKTAKNPEQRKKLIIYSISILIAFFFLALSIMNMPFLPVSRVKDEYKDTYDSLGPDKQRLSMKEGFSPINLTFNTTGFWVKDEVRIEWHSFLILAFIAGVGPTSFYEVRKRRKVDKIEERLSDFLRDISESMRAGQTLHEAIKTSSGGEYGNLSPEIKRMAIQVSWGVSASKALEMFGERVNTPLVKRSVTLINEAASAGGNVSNVIDAAAKDTREIQIIKKTRNTEMAMYTYVIAISFMVFLVVIAVMFATFMPRMEELSESYSTGDSSSSAQAPGGFDPTVVDFGVMKLLLFAAAAIQAVGDGVVGGIMSTGRISNGLFMSSIFAIVTLLAFDLVLL